MGAAGALQRGARAVTSSDYLSLVIVVLSIVGVGFFAASEVAITRINRVRAFRLREEGRRGAKQLTKIVDNPAPYLNVVLFLTLLFTIGGSRNEGIRVGDKWSTRLPIRGGAA